MTNYIDTSSKFLKSFSTLLATKSLAQISVNEICRESGLTRQTFYNYFSSKKEFLKESIFIFLDELTKILYTDLSSPSLSKP
ncbi:TetR/AcrR family transcriptional regulator [Streptococcus sp. 1001175B_160314_H6]|uniref:TetR/AcrR family transcriptional regulator n=1 Tax=Streptococcus TaxID=1301 RepID=UPI00110663E6